MKTYADKQTLLDTIEERYAKFRAEFTDIPEEKRELLVEGVDKTPSEMLSYQLGWLNLLLSWDRDEVAGIEVETPAPGYKWNNLGGLYQSFYEHYGQQSLQDQLAALDLLVKELWTWIETLSQSELFDAGVRRWATTKAQWPLWKWIHINSVAPFTNFRPKIRKWKKLAL